MFKKQRLVSSALAVVCAAVFMAIATTNRVGAQDPVPGIGEAAEQAGGRQGGGRQGGGAGQASTEPRPYAEVITSDAKTDDGVFKVHQIGERLFFEIPTAHLNKDFLWVTQIKRTTTGAGWGGQAAGNRVIQWTKKGDRILMLDINYSNIANPNEPIAQAVADSNNPTIIRAFPVAAYNDQQDPVIDVTQLFTTEIPEFSVRGRIGGRGFDANRTFLEKAVSFPENVNVEVLQTFTGATDAAPAAGRGRGGMQGPSATVLTHYSMVKLPETPMMPRLFDERVGYFTRAVTDYGTEEHRAEAKRFITRWRLEKKDPNAAISEPVKPIVYYVDPATPAKWVPFVKKG
ncbi:MAG: DUF5117 domain-containing protein, partial [Vicinamibacterales bacterium]